MAKSNTIQVKLVSTAKTGFFYVKDKNPKHRPARSRGTEIYQLLCALLSLLTIPRRFVDRMLPQTCRHGKARTFPKK